MEAMFAGAFFAEFLLGFWGIKSSVLKYLWAQLLDTSYGLSCQVQR